MELKKIQNTSAANTQKMNEYPHKWDIKNATDYRYYALPKSERIRVNIEYWNTQTPFGDEHFHSPTYMKYGQNKQLNISYNTPAADMHK